MNRLCYENHCFHEIDILYELKPLEVYSVGVSKDLTGCMSCSNIWSLKNPNSLLLDSFQQNINVKRFEFD